MKKHRTQSLDEMRRREEAKDVNRIFLEEKGRGHMGDRFWLPE